MKIALLLKLIVVISVSNAIFYPSDKWTNNEHNVQIKRPNTNNGELASLVFCGIALLLHSAVSILWAAVIKLAVTLAVGFSFHKNHDWKEFTTEPTTTCVTPTTFCPPPTCPPTTDPPTTVTDPPTTVTDPPTTVTDPPTTVTDPPTTVTDPPTTVTDPPTTVTDPPTTTPSTTDPPTTEWPQTPGVPCCKRNNLLVVLLDSSDNLSQEEFNILLELTETLAGYWLTNPGSKFGAVGFSSKTHVIFDLKQSRQLGKSDIIKRIRDTPHLKGNRSTHLGLYEAIKLFNEGENVLRLPQYVLLLTSGKSVSSDNTKIAAMALRDLGAKIFVAGIGKQPAIDEYNEIIFPEQRNLIIIPEFNQVNSSTFDISTLVCGCYYFGMEKIFQNEY